MKRHFPGREGARFEAEGIAFAQVGRERMVRHSKSTSGSVFEG